ncbi:ATP-binding cassette domain-containing protein [Micromonospora sp. NPDC047527]|uniref:ATP-binding cassette domain-containing protein n=1 Tax=Micromonospora sp. NPDC047527 TaxID=3155144 RepID=UPI0034067CF2
MAASAIRTQHLTKRYGRLLALDRLNLTVPAGEVFGFLGPNGAGKSTTIRLLLGLARPTAGRAWVFDVDAGDVGAAHRLLAYVPADVALWPQLTGAETLELLAATPWDGRRADRGGRHVGAGCRHLCQHRRGWGRRGGTRRPGR